MLYKAASAETPGYWAKKSWTLLISETWQVCVCQARVARAWWDLSVYWDRGRMIRAHMCPNEQICSLGHVYMLTLQQQNTSETRFEVSPSFPAPVLDSSSREPEEWNSRPSQASESWRPGTLRGLKRSEK